MLQYVYRFSIPPGRVNDFREWLDGVEPTMNDHQPEGWTYLGSWFAVRGFGSFDCEMRFELADYAALGAGFGDEENKRRMAHFFGEFVDPNFRPEAVLLKGREGLMVVEGA